MQSDLFLNPELITLDAGTFNRSIKEKWQVPLETRNMLSTRLQALLHSNATSDTRRALCEVLRGGKPRGWQRLNSLAKVCLELGVQLPDV